VSEAPTAVTQVNPNVPVELEQVVMWALNKNPADRPVDADQFIAALEHAKAAITSGNAGQRTAAFAAVGALAGTAGAVPPTSAYANPAAAASPPGPQDPQADGSGQPDGGGPDEPDEERKRTVWPWLALVAVLLLAAGGALGYLLTRPKQVTVTPVVGEQLNIAQTQLQNAGFKVDPQYQRNGHPYGYVFGQSPNGGVKADKGSSVTLTVSSGPGNVQVPPVQGESVTQAKAALASSHLKAGTTTFASSNSIANGDVISSSPAAGASVAPGSAVDLTVSTGTPKVKVPNVVGQTQSDAKSTLQNAGFSVTSSTQTTSSTTAGDVVSQSPSGGSEAASGSTVALVIAKAPPKKTTVTVPDVKGDTQTAATSTLQGAGLLVATAFKTVTNAAKNGIVLSERPSAHSSAKKGSTVTITVGQLKSSTDTTTGTTSTPTTSTNTTTNSSP
jgi:eukaryotic-like serine/threonine-protein kinase